MPSETRFHVAECTVQPTCYVESWGFLRGGRVAGPCRGTSPFASGWTLLPLLLPRFLWLFSSNNPPRLSSNWAELYELLIAEIWEMLLSRLFCVLSSVEKSRRCSCFTACFFCLLKKWEKKLCSNITLFFCPFNNDYRPPGGGRLLVFDMNVVSSYLFLRTYYI